MAIKLNNGGTGDYVTYDGTASPISTTGADDFTVAFWVKRDTDSGAADHIAGVFADLTGASVGIGFKCLANDNYALWKYGDSDYALTAGTVGSWFYLAYTTNGGFDGTGWHGTSNALTSASAPVNTATTLDQFLLGRYPGGINPFKGTIAHFRAWTAKLTEAELEAEMISATPVKTANLYLAWEFASDATDSSGNGRNGTISGSTYSFVDGPLGGGGSQALAGAATGGATASGAASVTKPLAGAAAGGATAAGELQSSTQALEGAATGGATAAGALDVTPARSFEFTLYAVDGSTPLASKTGLWWAWWPSIAAMRTDPPDAAGTGASTDGSGVFSVAAPSALSAGDNQGFGIISDQDATPDATEAAFVGSFDVV